MEIIIQDQQVMVVQKNSDGTIQKPAGGYWMQETRPCRRCRHFCDIRGDIPVCKKKLMGVTSNMYVSYDIRLGTCFEYRYEDMIGEIK